MASLLEPPKQGGGEREQEAAPSWLSDDRAVALQDKRLAPSFLVSHHCCYILQHVLPKVNGTFVKNAKMLLKSIKPDESHGRERKSILTVRHWPGDPEPPKYRTLQPKSGSS